MAGALTAAIASIFSGSAVTADPYYEYTTLLLPGNGTNGAQNNTFLDASTNNFTITRNGNTTQGTFSPFSQTGWGVYFDGNNDNCTSSTALFNYTTGNASTQTATVEAWVYLNAYAVGTSGSDNPSIAAKGSTYMNFGINPSGNLVLYWYDGTVKSITSSGTVPLNTWVYVAFTLSGGTATLYINGSSSGSGSWTGLQSAGINSTSYFGNTTSGPTTGINGYLSNLRVSTTARSISTPTSAFSNDGNTAFLSFQSNRFVDKSSNTYAITPSGNTSVQAFSPFNPTSSWSATTNGGSGYFDGSGDYLTVANNSAFDITQGDFTWECWVYRTVSGVDQEIANQRTNSPSVTGWLVRLNSSNKIVLSYVGSAYSITSSSSIVNNQWTHIAITRSGSNARIFINGNLDVTNSSFSNGLTSTSTLTIGKDEGSTGLYTGYLSNWRLVKGLAVYTAAFTPPTEPFTATQSANTNGNPSAAITGSSTSLLLNFTNGGIYDATSKNGLETVGNAQISTAQYKFGGSSMYFDGTGDWLLIPDQPPQRIGTGNFTVEMWVYRNSSGTYGLAGKGTGTTGWLVSLNSSNQVVFTYGSSTITSSGTVSATTWTHIAVVREGTSTNQTKIYISGTNDGTGTVSTDFNQTNSMYIGADRTGGSAANAYVQDVRITNYARYTANFTAPTAPFQTF